MTGYRMNRRRLMGAGAAMAGGLALGGAVQPHRLAAQTPAARQFSGQIVIALLGGDATNAPARQAVIDAYRVLQPGVEILWEPQDLEAGEYVTFLGTLLAAGDIREDIVSGNYQAAFRGYVNLDEYRLSVNQYTGETWEEHLNWDFFREVNGTGERIMLPTRSVHINWFYNKDLFDAAGATPPTTWAELETVCAALKESGVIPIAGNFDFQIPQWFAEIYFDQYHTHWIETVRAQPGDWNYDPALDDAFTGDVTDPFIHNTYTYNVQRFMAAVRDGVLRFDTPEVADIMRNMAAIFPEYATGDFFVIQFDAMYNAFLQQQVAIIPSGTWTLPALQQDLASLSPERLEQLELPADTTISAFQWGTFENPTMEGDLVKSPVRSVESATGEYLSIVNKNQEQTDLVVDFLQFFTSKTGHQIWVDAQAALPTFTPSGPIEVKGVVDPPEIQELFSQISLIGNAEVNYNGFWTAMAAGNIMQDTRNLFKDGLEGTLNPEEYASAVQSYATDNFDAILEASSLTDADLDDPSRQPGT